jgi:hypothetical protein
LNKAVFEVYYVNEEKPMALWGDRRWITDFNKPKAF